MLLLNSLLLSLACSESVYTKDIDDHERRIAYLENVITKLTTEKEVLPRKAQKPKKLRADACYNSPCYDEVSTDLDYLQEDIEDLAYTQGDQYENLDRRIRANEIKLGELELSGGSQGPAGPPGKDGAPGADGKPGTGGAAIDNSIHRGLTRRLITEPNDPSLTISFDQEHKASDHITHDNGIFTVANKGTYVLLFAGHAHGLEYVRGEVEVKVNGAWESRCEFLKGLGNLSNVSVGCSAIQEMEAGGQFRVTLSDGSIEGHKGLDTVMSAYQIA